MTAHVHTFLPNCSLSLGPCRCYSASEADPDQRADAALKELEPLKLPGKLADFTGTVLYPNEESAVWDVDGRCILMANTNYDGWGQRSTLIGIKT